jgi:biotin synthase
MGGVGNIIQRLQRGGQASEAEIEALLRCGGDDLAALYAAADRVRQEQMGDEVFLRGIIEFSNYCRRSCAYCGIRGPNRTVTRYRMTAEEIVVTAVQAEKLGNTTVVLQSGEDPWFTRERLCALLRAIKGACGVAITLSIGERPLEELIEFKRAGCDRYLLRFETSDRALFGAMHPDDDYDERIQCLRDLRTAGIQVGSGFMIGLPGGTLRTIARDVLFATGLDLDMIGCGPYLSHPETPLAGKPLLEDTDVYFKTIAILRLLNPKAHIPATTAFDALMEGGRDTVLTRGANVFMPNVTPRKYRVLYQLYPNKPCVDEDSGQCARCVVGRVARLGRRIGQGRGDSRKTGSQASGDRSRGDSSQKAT